MVSTTIRTTDAEALLVKSGNRCNEQRSIVFLKAGS
jgi:hypothetical protein